MDLWDFRLKIVLVRILDGSIFQILNYNQFLWFLFPSSKVNIKFHQRLGRKRSGFGRCV